MELRLALMELMLALLELKLAMMELHKRSARAEPDMASNMELNIATEIVCLTLTAASTVKMNSTIIIVHICINGAE